MNLEHLKNSHEDLLEALKVPILVDDGVDNSGIEDLLRFVSKEIHEVVHLVDRFNILHVLLAPLRQQLLSNQVDQILDILVLSELFVFSWILQSHFDLVY